jgi:hypothetical protein
LFWWGLMAIVVAIVLLLLGLYYWSSKDPSIDREISKDQFRAEQELRWLRRSQRSTSTSTRDKQ